MVTTRGKGRAPTHIDTAAAWQQQQQLAQLRSAAASLPDAAALPVKAAQEVRRVLLLLQRSRNMRNTSSSSSSDLGNLGLDVEAAVDVAAGHISRLLQELQPQAAAAACVHAHLFAAWVRGVTSTAGASAADNSAIAGTAATDQDAGMPEATEEFTVSTVAAAARAAGASSTWGPISQAWTLSSYQYGRLLLLLNAPGMLLDQMAWVQLPGALNMPWQQQQQQSQEVAAAAQLSCFQLMLLAEVGCAVPALAGQLLLQLLQPRQAAVAADTAGAEANGSSKSSSSSSACQLAPVPAVLLLCLCGVAGSAAGVSAFNSQLDKLSCLHVLCHAAHMLLPAAQLEEQSQVERGIVAVPQAVLQLISSAAAKAAKAGVSQQQQQQQRRQQQGLPSGNSIAAAGSAQQAAGCPAASSTCWSLDDTISVTISHQRLLAGLLQLLQDLLLQWGDTWYSNSSSSSSCVEADVGSVSIEGVQSQLSQIQHQLRQLLPQYLAAQQAAPSSTSPQQQADASSSCNALLQQLLPASLSHQLLVHNNSRLALALMMMQTSGQQQQQPLLQPAAAAASKRSDGDAWAAVCGDPFGRAAQQLLRCTASSSSQQQQAGKVKACSTQVTYSSTGCNQPGWLSCFAASQAKDVAPSQGSSGNAATAADTAADAASPQLHLPYSFLRMRHQQQQQQQQQQQACVYTAAPVYTAAAHHGCTPQQQPPAPVQAAASHMAGLAAAWLTPGYSLCPLLQPPTAFVGSAWHLDGSALADAAAPANDSTSIGAIGGATDLLAQVSTAAGTSTYGHLRVCCCIVQMLLHVVSLQLQQQQQQQQQLGCSNIAWQPRCAGVVQLLLAMLAEATQQLEQPELQQALLSALHPTSHRSTTHPSQQQQQGAGLSKTLEPAVLDPAFGQGLLNPWTWLREQLSSPDLAAAASRGLVAASNKLVQGSEEEENTTGAANAAGVVTRVVLPQQRREALLLAELSRVLLLYQALWPELTVRRLLLDAVQHRSQQPLVVQLLKGMQGACGTPAALTPALTPAAAHAAADGRSPEHQQQQQQQQQEYLAVPLLLDQLLRLLLPLPTSYHTTAGARGSGCSCVTAAPKQQQQQQQVLELTEAQQQSAVQLLQQLLTAGLLQQQDALLLLCLQPLQSIWQQQQQHQQQPEQAMQSRYSHSQLRLLLQLTESLLGLETTTRSAAAAVPGSEYDSSCSWAAGHAQCMCPLVCTAHTAAVLAFPAAADASQAEQQQSLGAVKWLLLGLCQIQQQLQQAAWLDHRPDYKGSCQTAALLEALVMWLVQHGEPASLLLLQGDQTQQQQQQQLVGSMPEELQQLTWQQRLLIGCLLRPQQRQTDATASEFSSSSSSSGGGGEALLSRLLLPDSLASMQPSNGSSNSAAQAPMQLAQARQLLLDCCEFAATSNAHALLLAQQCTRTADPAGSPHAVDPPHEQHTIQAPASLTKAAALAAAVQQLPWQQLRRGLTLALGQFLPWAAEHQSARVLLRLLPALLQSTLGQHLQQQQQGVTLLSGALDAVDASDAGHQPLQPARKVTAMLWCAELQLVVRAAFLFLQHGKWAQPQAAARFNSNSSSGSGSGTSGLEQARQVAAEQCFRHVSLLVLYIASQAREGLASAAAAQSGSDSCGAGTREGAAQALENTGAGPNSGLNGAADEQASFELVQVCVQELCRLAAALSGCVECSFLQVLLLQLLQQLLAGTVNSKSAAAAGAGEVTAGAGAAALSVPPPPPPVPAAVAMPAAAATADQEAGQTVQQRGAASKSVTAVEIAEGTKVLGSVVLDNTEGAEAADGATGAQPKSSGWHSAFACAGVTYGQLLGWVGQQLQLLPEQLQQLLVPAVVHMAEQQLVGLLGRSLIEEESEDLERMLWIAYAL